MRQPSYLDYNQTEFLENLFEQYTQDPQSIDAEWKKFFDGMEFARAKFPMLPHQEEQASSSPSVGSIPIAKQIGVLNLINAYRARGHLIAENNPIRPRSDHKARLELENFGLNNTDLNTEFEAGSELGIGRASLKSILDFLHKTYCRSLGIEYMHMRKPDVLEWLQSKMEACQNTPNFTLDDKKKILHKLNEAEVFEKFLQTKYMGQKRFSLEGAEMMIPALEHVIHKGSKMGAKHFMFGMAHRGRLNVLANILGKTYEDIFAEFEDIEGAKGVEGTGDVKYHKGYSTIRKIDGNDVKLTLAFNPSHLEAVNTVAAGMARAKTEQWFDGDHSKIVPIVIHGDAAISGQGIVYEHLQMSNLEAFTNGGTIHLVINNQVGFTTHYKESRSSIYCTDIAKGLFAPVFHVNGSDPEAVIYAMEMATEFRQKYQRDVFIDLVCFRRYGHNESDEPRFTQPIMYKTIDKLLSPREQYKKELSESGLIEAEVALEMEKEFKSLLQERMEKIKEDKKANPISVLQSKWAGLRYATQEDFEESPETGLDLMRIQQVVSALTSHPETIKPIKKVKRLLADRLKMIENDKINWGLAELLSYGSTLIEGHPVRMSGQDVQRGTFTHRHAVIYDEATEAPYCNLNHIVENQSIMRIYNSLLSEYGVLGFEYGYSLSTPKRLTIWEAQFGDFSNGAQIIIDQFISSAETKWGLSSGLVMLLPHGYEGQGPEHSSARLERFLQLCAHRNIQVVNCTTPANFFHVMRRQVKRDFRKPLVVMTPKSLLRHPECTSSLKELAPGTKFKEIIDDESVTTDQVKKVLIVSGKLYYELNTKRKELKKDNVAIIRLEQLFPLPEKQIKALIQKYASAKNWIWVQEEPINMGSWDYIHRCFTWKKLKVIARQNASSPAEGSAREHAINQATLINQCFK
jgi:2-oxoglutarate dehydrogenase E1 component